MPVPPETGPVVLPPDPDRVASNRVAELASAGVTHRPPTAREFELAAFNVALEWQPEENLYAVLNHLTPEQLDHLDHATEYLRNAVRALRAERLASRVRGTDDRRTT